MTKLTLPTDGPILVVHPGAEASAKDWVNWYCAEFLPTWIERARDPSGIGYFDYLDDKGQRPQSARKTILAQARLLFTFSHLAMLTGDAAYYDAARTAREAIDHFRKPSGLYRRALDRAGAPTDDELDSLATSYDQSFIMLSLATWGQLDGSEDTGAEMDSCWAALQTHLTDPATGLLLEHDGLDDPAASSAPPRAQNPHMHNYEAALQAFEMTEKPVWLERAAAMRAKGLEYFFDDETGTIAEFIAPDLTILPGRDGLRREIGHQCEWAWLLLREADLGGDPAMRAVAARLLKFADECGFAKSGAMQGAAFDAVSADRSWREDRFLLWPQTEAMKTAAVRAKDAKNAAHARTLAQVIFGRYFMGRAAFVNQLDPEGMVLWPEALSRLHYHIVLGITEGSRAGLWSITDEI